MDILTKIISPIFSSRYKKIESFSKQSTWIQESQLKYLIEYAQNTEWGKKYYYNEIRDYKTFHERVPVSPYERLFPFIERMIKGEKNILWPSKINWFAKSSGTTNDKSKYIPVSKEILNKCHYKGGFDSVAIYLDINPESNFFSKKGLILGGSHKPSALNKQSKCGDLSAVLLQNLNPIVNIVRVPSKKIILMDEWESKIKVIVENTWNKDVVSISGIPSWMLVLIEAILKKTGKTNLNEVWPNLEVFFHGGVSFEPFREKYRSLISSEKMFYIETYNASEGFFGIQNDLSDKSMLLMLDYGIFYEFISTKDTSPDNPRVIPLAEVNTEDNYEIVISTAGGLWRYRIGDTIRFTSLNPYKFVITGRTKLFINAFGEELMVENVEKAISKAAIETDSVIKAFTAAPEFLLDKNIGRHQWLIEFDKQPASLINFATCLDKALKELNSDYEAKRYKDITLLMPEIIVARGNLFNDWLQQKGKLGGQHKIPSLMNNRSIIEELIKMNR
jgi:hypothetical protein